MTDGMRHLPCGQAVNNSNESLLYQDRRIPPVFNFNLMRTRSGIKVTQRGFFFRYLFEKRIMFRL